MPEQTPVAVLGADAFGTARDVRALRPAEPAAKASGVQASVRERHV